MTIFQNPFFHYSKIKTMENSEYLQDAIQWGVELGVEIARDMEDKKFTLGEGLALFDNILKIPKLVRNMKHLPKEWEQNKDSQEYTDKIISSVHQQVVGVGSDVARDLVLQGIRVGLEISRFINLCVDARKGS